MKKKKERKKEDEKQELEFAEGFRRINNIGEEPREKPTNTLYRIHNSVHCTGP